MKDVVAGLDPGKLGAIAFLDENDRCYCKPTKLAASHDGNEFMCAAWLSEWLDFYSPKVLCVERQHPRPMDGKKSIFSLGRGYGRLEAVIDLFAWSSSFISPQEWKKEVLKGTKKDKEAAIAFVSKKYPYIDLHPNGQKNPSDGMADAICLAYYARRYL